MSSGRFTITIRGAKVNKRGFFKRLAGNILRPFKRPSSRKHVTPKPEPAVSRLPTSEPSGRNYTLAGWRLDNREGGDEHGWHDVEAGADLPHDGQWKRIDLVTVNLAPDSTDGFYRSANVFKGFDEYTGKPTYNFYDEDPSYTLDNLAFELALEYGFAVQ